MDADEVARDLYALAPEEFIAARGEAVRAAKASGDAALARTVQAWRKPTVAAWLVNQVVRTAELELRTLLTVGEELRDGMTDLSGEELRALTRRRQDAVAALVGRAAQVAEGAGKRAAQDTLMAVRATFEATLADPASADEVRRGCLSEPLEVGGFAFAFPGGGVAAVGTEPEPQSASVSDLAEHRERRADAIRAAEASVAAATKAAKRAAARVVKSEQRLGDATEKRVRASVRVDRLAAELDDARNALAKAEKRQHKRESDHEVARDAADEAAEAVADAKAALAHLRP